MMEKIIKTLNLENSQNFALLECGMNNKLHLSLGEIVMLYLLNNETFE